MSTFRLLAAYVSAAGGQAAALGVASETDSALALGRAKARALGVASSTASAGAITTTGPLGIGEETDTALPLSVRKTRLLGVAPETDTALTVGRAKARALGVAAETDAAIALGRSKRKLLGIAVSTNTALSIERAGGLPAFISGEGTQVDGAGAAIEAASFYGPFKDSNGNLYTVTEDDANTFRTAMRKSTDGGVTWAEIDGANRPTNDDLESVWIVQADETLYLLSQPSGTSTVRHHTFNTSDAGANPDTWQLKAEAVNVPGTAPSDQSVSLVRRSDGDLIAFYRAAPVGGFQRIGYRIKPSAGSWSAETLLDTTASKNFTQVQAVLGESDVTHILYANETDTSILHRTLSASDVLSGSQAINDGAAKALRNPMANRVLYHDDAGTERIYVAWLRASDDKLVGCEIVNGAISGDEVISDNALYHSPVNGGSFQPVAAITNDDLTVFAVYADATTHDLFLSTRTAGTWGVDEEVTDGVDAMGVTANVYTHSVGNGEKRVVGYVFHVDTGFDSGDKSYYDEDPLSLSEALGTATSTSTALALGRAKARTLAFAAETDTALALGKRKGVGVAVAAETDTALAVTVGTGQLGTASEADTAGTLGRRKTVALMLAAETDTALPVHKRKGVGLALEVDTALALARSKVSALGIALGTDVALALGDAKRKLLGLAAETDTALTVTPVSGSALGPALETDTALALGKRKTFSLGVSAETDTAQVLGRLKSRVLATAAESDLAGALARVKARLLGAATETDAARTLTAGLQVAPAAETDTALQVAPSKRKALGSALELSTALALSRGHARQLGVSLEADTARPIGLPRILGVATETDLALAVTLAGAITPEAYTRGVRIVMTADGPVRVVMRAWAAARIADSGNVPVLVR